MGKGDLTGPDKAAIFLLFMGEEYSSDVFKKLDDGEIKALSASMAKIGQVTPERLEQLLQEFMSNMGTGGNMLVKGETFLKRAVTKAIGTRKAEAIFGELEGTTGPKENAFEGLKAADPRLIAEFIRAEHPQTIAMILGHMDPLQAAQVLVDLPERLQPDVIYRVAKLEGVPPDVVGEVDRLLSDRLRSLTSMQVGQKAGGVTAVAELLNHVDSNAENAILSQLEEEDADLADEIRQCMFVFEDLASVDDRGIMALMREVANEDLTLALKTAAPELKEKVLRNISERARMVIQEDLETMGPVRLKDVESAQQRIVRAAKKLEEEGKLTISSKGADEVFV
ncbi:MAG: flagellar motor switch protein FliG [Pseudomonadota bacterium]